jgi:hypothetical protein
LTVRQGAKSPGKPGWKPSESLKKGQKSFTDPKIGFSFSNGLQQQSRLQKTLSKSSVDDHKLNSATLSPAPLEKLPFGSAKRGGVRGGCAAPPLFSRRSEHNDTNSRENVADNEFILVNDHFFY